jgi:hypothetical protein
MEIGVRLTVVGGQVEADMICSLLRAHGIKCAERALDVSILGTGGFGGSREILVSKDDVADARDLIPSLKGGS